MIGWLPIMLLATAVIMAGVFHLLAVRMAPPANPASLTRPNPILDSPTYAGSVVVLPTPERDKRVFIQKEPSELVAPLHGQTDYTGQRLVADYLKKWVHWLVPLYDVSQVEAYPLVSAIIAGGHAQLFIMVYVAFAPGERDKVVHLEKGTLIEIEGKIGNIYKAEVRLVDCRLLGIRLPEG